MRKNYYKKIRLKAIASAFAVIVGTAGVTGVAYAEGGTISSDMVSVGVFNYSSSGTSKYDIVLDARDIANLAEAVDTLNNEYTNAIAELSEKKYALVQAMDSTITAKNNILPDGATNADDISFDTIISAISNMQSPSTATASYYAGGAGGNNTTNGYLADSGSVAASSSVSSGSATINLNTSGASDLTIGVNESVTLESGYYTDPVTVSNGVVNRGAVSVNFTKAVQNATLDSGYYDGISIDVKDLYNIGYMDGAQDSEKKVIYSTIRINPGEHGMFTSDSSTASKTFNGPSYTGFTMDVTPTGAYKLTGWDTSITEDGTISMTAHWVDDEVSTSTINSFKSGSYFFGKDYVTSITINALNSLTVSTSNGKGGVFTDDENQITNSQRSITASASYDLYVNGEYWKTISCTNTTTDYGTKSNVTTIWDNGHKLYSYAYSWSATAQTTVTFEEPVRYLTIVANTVDRNADVTVERYIDD